MNREYMNKIICPVTKAEFDTLDQFIDAATVYTLKVYATNTLKLDSKYTAQDIVKLKRPELIQLIKTGDIATPVVSTPRTSKVSPQLGGLLTGLDGYIVDAVDRALADRTPKIFEYRAIDNTSLPTISGRQHYLFPLIQIMIRCVGVNSYFLGEKGNGKSSAVLNAVKSLGLNPIIIACNRDLQASSLLGYCTATGSYNPGLVYNAYKLGGCIILEEFDSLSPGVRLCLNNLIANNLFTFPNGETVERHADFRCAATGNTKAIGATQAYSARQAQDSASIDRFAYLDIPLDEALEASLIGVDNPTKYQSPSLDLRLGGVPTPTEWLDTCRDYRQAIKKACLDGGCEVSTRSVIMGNILANAGIGKSHLITMLLTKTLSTEQATKVNGYLEGGY